MDLITYRKSLDSFLKKLSELNYDYKTSKKFNQLPKHWYQLIAQLNTWELANKRYILCAAAALYSTINLESDCISILQN